jgi:glyoxylase-like metal-dependent hydrolase (beta-lactamase superfamily II)
MPQIPLEDLYNDVLSKAALGLKIKPEDLAARASLEAPVVQQVLKGDFDEATVRRLAPLLALGEDQLVALGIGAYSPEVTPPDGLLGFNTPYHDFFVNAYLIWDESTKQAVIFDTGTEPDAILKAVQERGLKVERLLMTHSHPDHIMGLDALRQRTGAPAYISPKESVPGTEPVEAGRTFQVGKLTIKALDTWGHSAGGTSYFVTGLSRPVVVVGDALFAASMGRGNVSYPEALTNNRRELFSLPDETVIAPGHGPLTTVELEKQNNPFYPEFAR